MRSDKKKNQQKSRKITPKMVKNARIAKKKKHQKAQKIARKH